ncbi:MAG: tetratricopeptide repeat protein [Thermodesulfobacteriota bacterium]
MSDKELSEDLNAVIAELEGKCAEMPKSVVAHHHLAMVYHKAGRHNDAVKELKECIKIDDQSGEAYINLGAIYFEMGKLDESLEANKKALHYTPADSAKAQAHCNIGLIEQQHGKLPEALDAYTKATMHDPKLAFAWINLASVQIAHDDFAAALVSAKKGVEHEPDFPMAHNNLAVALYYNKDYAGAKKALDKAKQLGYAPEPLFVEALEKEL